MCIRDSTSEAYKIYFELSRATERTVTIPFTFTDYATIQNGAQGAGASGAYPVDWYYSSSTSAAGGTADWTSGGLFDATGSIDIINSASDANTKIGFFSITIQTDDYDEWDETFVVNLGAPTNGQRGSASTHTVTITDASSPPVIGFSSLLVDDGTAEAEQATADYDLSSIIALTPKSGRDLQFTYKTEVPGTGATATGGQDYEIIDGTFTITAGQTAPSSSMFLDILDENVDEDDKQTAVSYTHLTLPTNREV